MNGSGGFMASIFCFSRAPTTPRCPVESQGFSDAAITSAVGACPPPESA
ncbi:hypothetical protein ABLE93_14910 [Xanthobacter sp. KR7-65]